MAKKDYLKALAAYRASLVSKVRGSLYCIVLVTLFVRHVLYTGVVENGRCSVHKFRKRETFAKTSLGIVFKIINSRQFYRVLFIDRPPPPRDRRRTAVGVGYVSGSGGGGGGGGGSPQISGKLCDPLLPVLALVPAFGAGGKLFKLYPRARVLKTSFFEGFLYTSGLNETFGDICTLNNVKAFKYIFSKQFARVPDSRVSSCTAFDRGGLIANFVQKHVFPLHGL